VSRRPAARPTIVLAVGARPNLMKAWALLRAFGRERAVACRLVHTGQHYDDRMSGVFFEELGLPTPAVHLGIGSDTPARQTARIMLAFERVLAADPPALVMVVGDVNSTLACALVGAKLGIPVAHVEAGLRSRDFTMPEELNRVLTDRLARWLFAPSADAVRNLEREGIPPSRVHLVGNVMIDTLRAHRRRADRSNVLWRLGLRRTAYAVLTLHRPANVDEHERFGVLLSALEWIQRRLPVVFPVHPRTRAQLGRLGLEGKLARLDRVIRTEPLGYLDFLKLMAHARLVLTDSGGVQEETTALSVPCLTLRDSTERPVTVRHGTNVVVGADPDRIIVETERILDGRGKRGRLPPYWDGRAGRRIARILVRDLGPGSR
jgi:UDP-N-acetylglucosamine 2-epimerase (non-hydrolysing)